MDITFRSAKELLSLSMIERMMRIVRGARRELKYIPKLFYFRSFAKRATFSVLSEIDTVERIIKKHVSIARFGDGEYCIMRGGSSGFQRFDPKLRDRLIEVLTSDNDTCLICIPRPLICQIELSRSAKYYWSDFIKKNGDFILKITPCNELFGNSMCTRFYIGSADKSRAKTIIDQFRKVWENRDICIVEGENSRLGCGNDLFNNAKSIKRIICPPTNAYQEYDRILASVKNKTDKGQLLLLALGMTATVLAYDLSKIGYQALDVGHIDIEYEWYLMKATSKVPITGKAVNECNQNFPQNIIDDNQYNESVIDRVL